MSDLAGKHLNQSAGGISFEIPLGFSGAPRAQLWAWQPSSLSLQPLTIDANGSLVTSATLSGNAGNAAAGLTGVGVPTSADYGGWNNGGTLVGTSVAAPLPVQVISGGGGGTQYADGATQATPTGTVALGKNPTNVLHALGLDASGNLLAWIQNTSLAVTGTFWQATQPVSGTFWQATQPVSIAAAVTVAQATAANLNATVVGTVAVSNFPGTQPVSGTVAVSNFPATQAVTGTFWQATQPVSAASLPLPAGAATSALQSSIITALGSPLQAGGAVSVSNLPAVQAVKPDGTVWGLTGTAANVFFTNGDVTASGTLTAAAQTVAINTGDMQTVGVDISGTWVGTITPEVTVNGSTWYPVTFVDTGGGLLGLTWSANNLAQINVGGMAQLRVRASAWTSGTATITLRASDESSVFALNESLPQGGNTIGNVNVNGTVPVSGTFWQATQPVSGTFFQATQPVSVAASVAVTGTFWQATQPVSGTVTANQGTANTAANAWFAKITDGTNTGAVKAASTAAAATDPAQVVSFAAANSATKIGDGTNNAAIKAASTAAVAADPALVVAVSPNNTVGITVPTLTKGTQGATGLTVQELKDAGRNTRIFMLDAFTAAPLVEAVQTVVQWYGNAAVAGTTQPAVVPAGKTLRLTGYKIMYQSLATVGCAVVRIRANTAGLGVLASPLVYSFEAGSGAGATTTAMTGGMTVETGDFPDGLELPAGTGVAFSMAGYGPTGTLTLEGTTRFAVYGFEY